MNQVAALDYAHYCGPQDCGQMTKLAVILQTKDPTLKANAVVHSPAQQSTLTFSNLVRTWVVVSGYGTVLYSRIIIGYYVRFALEFTTIALMTDILYCFPLYFCFSLSTV
jgi:hypothetical protein